MQQFQEGEGEIFECEFPGCNKRFTTKFSLKRHYYIHTKVKTYQCETCDKTFALPQYLKEHQFTHSQLMPFQCGIEGCDQTFRQRGKLSLHRRTHKTFQKKQYRLLNSDLHPLPAILTQIKEQNISTNQTLGKRQQEEIIENDLQEMNYDMDEIEIIHQKSTFKRQKTSPILQFNDNHISQLLQQSQEKEQKKLPLCLLNDSLEEYNKKGINKNQNKITSNLTEKELLLSEKILNDEFFYQSPVKNKEINKEEEKQPKTGNEEANKNNQNEPGFKGPKTQSSSRQQSPQTSSKETQELKAHNNRLLSQTSSELKEQMGALKIYSRQTSQLDTPNIDSTKIQINLSVNNIESPSKQQKGFLRQTSHLEVIKEQKFEKMYSRQTSDMQSHQIKESLIHAIQEKQSPVVPKFVNNQPVNLNSMFQMPNARFGVPQQQVYQKLPQQNPFLFNNGQINPTVQPQFPMLQQQFQHLMMPNAINQPYSQNLFQQNPYNFNRYQQLFQNLNQDNQNFSQALQNDPMSQLMNTYQQNLALLQTLSTVQNLNLQQNQNQQ